jgi:hypothetical protein
MSKYLTIILFALLVTACDDTITVEDVDNKVIPDKDVSFAEHIYPVLQVKCAFTGCHATPSPAGGLDLTTYANVTADINVVFPGEPDLSSMVWAIEAAGGVQPMPPTGSGLALTENQIKGIRTWIKEGAKNN